MFMSGFGYLVLWPQDWINAATAAATATTTVTGYDPTSDLILLGVGRHYYILHNQNNKNLDVSTSLGGLRRNKAGAQFSSLLSAELQLHELASSFLTTHQHKKTPTRKSEAK